MTLGKRLLVFSDRDASAHSLNKIVADWGCMVSTCESMDEFRGRVEGADYDLAVVESTQVLRRLLGENQPEQATQLTLAEIEKRHIHRVLASTGGNKTRAARVLGIDTKTLYNKLKSYKASEAMARRRLQNAGAVTMI